MYSPGGKETTRFFFGVFFMSWSAPDTTVSQNVTRACGRAAQLAAHNTGGVVVVSSIDDTARRRSLRALLSISERSARSWSAWAAGVTKRTPSRRSNALMRIFRDRVAKCDAIAEFVSTRVVIIAKADFQVYSENNLNSTPSAGERKNNGREIYKGLSHCLDNH